MAPGFCRETLASLGCVIEEGEPWKVTAPSFRLDLEREVDLIEEVARVYGMDRIEAVLPTVKKSLQDLDKVDPTFAFLNQVKEWGRGIGLAEVVNYSFVGTADLDRCGLPAEGRVHIFNPLSEEMNVLRTELAPGLLGSLRQNMSQDNTRIRIFEVAHTFVQDPDSDTLTRENNRLAILLHGGRFPARYPFPEGSLGYEDVKGLVEHLLMSLGVGAAAFERGGEHPYLAPEVLVRAGEKTVGRLGRIREDLADAYQARGEVWFADLDLDLLMSLRRGATFRTIPRFPVVRRDMTLIAAPGLAIGAVVDTVKEMNEPLLEDVYLVDIFTPAGSEERNLSYRFVFRHPERTLKDKEVEKINQRIGQHLAAKLPVRFS
jgi:phenylalanyl-tRNA synthetase beta chain